MLKTGKAGELRWLPPHLIIVPTLNPQDMLEFPAQELRKYFKMGDHVKVIAGRFEGDTGLIVRVEENFVILFSDLTMHELKVLPRDLQLCSETASGVDVGGQHEWGELVQLDPQTVGVIVRLERETFQVSVPYLVTGLTLGGFLSLELLILGVWQNMVVRSPDCSGLQTCLCQLWLAT